MKYAIFSDMHGNLGAYESVLNDVAKENPDKYFCIGDIIGYGANPNECLNMTRALAPVTVCGNHDWASVELTSREYFNEYARQAVIWTSSELTDEVKDYIRTLRLTYTDDDLTMVHGTWMRPENFDYVFDFQTASKMLKMIPTRIGFIGHSHVAGIFFTKDGRPEYSVQSKIKIERDQSYLINVGSVGQPRDGDKRASYCIWDKDKGTIEMRRVEYDIEKAKKKIIDAGLPRFLATRLSEGR